MYILPKLLREIPDPPKKLHIRGSFPSEDHYCFLTVVGSRKYSDYGKAVCQQIIKELRGYPIVIVSGLAIGIDMIAHQAALEYGMKTIAVPGSGLSDEVLYPKEHRLLARRILQSGGCLISEYEDTFKATRWSFPRRNRIMAGISHATLVIEAEEHSGTGITAQLAVEYNREVMVVPGSIFSKNTIGAHKLIQEGAFLVNSGKDILEHLNITP